MRKRITNRKMAAGKIGKGQGKRTARKQSRKARRIPGSAANVEIVPVLPRGRGPYTGGQSGDIQGLPALEGAGPESVIELAEEGQDYEAELVSGLESAPDADQGEVRSRRFREESVPLESAEEE
jgi:hypothetical protein